MEMIDIPNANPELRKLNEDLQINPNIAIPDGFKKVIEPTVELQYELPYKMPIPKKFKIAYEIVNEIISKALG